MVCMPYGPTRAAAGLTPRARGTELAKAHMEKSPLSNPSAKIRSGVLGVGVAVGVLVRVAVNVGVIVAVWVGVGVFVGVPVRVLVGVIVGVPVIVLVGVSDGGVPEGHPVRLGAGRYASGPLMTSTASVGDGSTAAAGRLLE